MSEFDTEFTDQIVCPFCGETCSDSWEYGESDDEFCCGHCDRESSLTVYVTVAYSTSPLLPSLQHKLKCTEREVDRHHETPEFQEIYRSQAERLRKRIASIEKLDASEGGEEE